MVLGPEIDGGEDRGGPAQTIAQELQRRVAHAAVGGPTYERFLGALVVESGPTLLGSVPGVPAVPARRDAQVGVVVQVLAEQAGLVPGVVQPGGDGAVLQPLVSELLPPAQGEGVAVDTGVVGVLAAQEGRPRRAAQGEGRDHVGKLDALAYEV